MKPMINLVIAITTLFMFGFLTINLNNKIAEPEKDIGIPGGAITCSAQKVSDKNLAVFIKNNSQNPDLNVVKVNVKIARDALKNHSSSDNVFVAVMDTDSSGKNFAIISEFPNNLVNVCHLRSGPGLPPIGCCPPPNRCDPGFNNYCQFFQNQICRTEEVLDKNLAAFMKINLLNPALNAVKLPVKRIREALNSYSSSDNVYLTITDSDSFGRNLAIIAEYPNSIHNVCHLKAGQGPVYNPGFTNHIQFFQRQVLLNI